MAATRKYTDEQRDALCRLVNDTGISVPKAVQALAAGHEELPPMQISEDYARQLAREDRIARGINVKDLPLTEAMDTIARQALELANRELARLHGTNGALDADHFLKIARSLRELQPLAQASSQEKAKDHDTGSTPAWLHDLTAPTQPSTDKPENTTTDPSMVGADTDPFHFA